MATESVLALFGYETEDGDDEDMRRVGAQLVAEALLSLVGYRREGS